MADRPILFSAPMVRALLDGRKSQTRRALNPQPEQGVRFAGVERDGQWLFTEGCYYGKMRPPYKVGDRLYVREEYYQRGHWAPVTGAVTKGGKQKWAFVPADNVIRFDAPGSFRNGRHHHDPETVAWHKRLGRFMPRWASRLTLTVTEVRVQQLQDISEADAIAEGLFWQEPTDEDREWAKGFAEENGGDDEIRGVWTIPGTDCGFGPKPRQPLWGPTAVSAYHALWNSINGAGSWEANPWVCAVSFTVERRNIDD